MSHIPPLQLMNWLSGRLVTCPRSDREFERVYAKQDPNWLSVAKLPQFCRAGKENQKENPGVLTWNGVGCSR